jgi:hypothetical protein
VIFRDAVSNSLSIIRKINQLKESEVEIRVRDLTCVTPQYSPGGAIYNNENILSPIPMSYSNEVSAQGEPKLMKKDSWEEIITSCLVMRPGEHIKENADGRGTPTDGQTRRDTQGDIQTINKNSVALSPQANYTD